jgi:hypothetical protein
MIVCFSKALDRVANVFSPHETRHAILPASKPPVSQGKLVFEEHAMNREVEPRVHPPARRTKNGVPTELQHQSGFPDASISSSEIVEGFCARRPRAAVASVWTPQSGKRAPIVLVWVKEKRLARFTCSRNSRLSVTPINDSWRNMTVSTVFTPPPIR